MARARRRLQLPRRESRPRGRASGMSGRGSTGARRSPCSACSACSSRSTSRRSAPTPGRSARRRSPPTACSAPLVRAADGAVGPRRRAHAGRARGRARRGRRDRRLAAAESWRPGVLVAPASPSSCWSPFPRRCSRSGCATARRRGSTRTTRPTRSSSPATLVRARAHPVRPRLRRLRARAVLQPRRQPCRRRPSIRRSRSTHFAYFPGTALTAAAWSFVPSPFDDYRVLVLLATIGCFFAVLLFDAPLPWRLAVGRGGRGEPAARARRVVRDRRRAGILALLLAFAC